MNDRRYFSRKHRARWRSANEQLTVPYQIQELKSGTATQARLRSRPKGGHREPPSGVWRWKGRGPCHPLLASELRLRDRNVQRFAVGPPWEYQFRYRKP